MDSLERLSADVVACRACPRLVEWRELVALEKRAAYRADDYWGRPVPGFGDPAASIVVVGLAPAAHGANRTGRMFTGDRSGEWLYRALWRAGLASRPESMGRDDGLELTGAYITAPVRCAPPANKPTVDERDRCRPFLERELALLDQARVYVVLGQFGYQVLCGALGVRPRPKFGHGVEVPLPIPPAAGAKPSGAGPSGPGGESSGPGGESSGPGAGPSEAVGATRTMVCSYHVSQQNTFTGKLTESMLDDVFRRARELADEPPVSRR